MSHSLLIAFVMFATVMFFTPGPNNIMLLSSGLTYGFRRTLPHVAGITIGFAFMVGAVGLGLGTIFISYPVLQTILKYAGAAYLIWLAAAIAMSGPVTPGQDNARGPMTFWGAAMFQWINAKGWVIERMLTDIGFTLQSVDYHAPLHGTYLLRKPKQDQQS